MTSQLTEEEEKAKNLGKLKNKQEMMMVDLEGKGHVLSENRGTFINAVSWRNTQMDQSLSSLCRTNWPQSVRKNEGFLLVWSDTEVKYRASCMTVNEP